jgi:hypothetical protein
MYIFSKKTGAVDNTAIVVKAEDMHVWPMYPMLSGQKEYCMSYSFWPDSI